MFRLKSGISSIFFRRSAPFFAIASPICLMSFLSASSAFGFEIPKASFEQKTGVLVWKMSGAKEHIDASDDLTDLRKSCDALVGLPASDSRKILAQRSKSAPIFHALVESNTKTLIRKLGLDKTPLKLNSVMAEIGNDDKPIFFLFPEVHLNYSTRALHRSLANDILKITHILDRNKTRILNTYEGAQGTWEKTRDASPWSVRERNIEATTLFDKLNYSASRIIGEVYNDRIETEYHDDNDLAIKNILALQAYTHSQQGVAVEEGWALGVKFVKSTVPGRARLVDLDEYESFYSGLRAMNPLALKKKPSELCEERSLQMAKYTIELAKKRHAKVIYMSFGALHAHGIIRQLKNYSASFIVFSPNL